MQPTTAAEDRSFIFIHPEKEKATCEGITNCSNQTRGSVHSRVQQLEEPRCGVA